MIAASVLLLLATPPATPPTPAPSDKKVCKSQAEVGSRIPKRVCMTAAQWAAVAEQTRDDRERSARERRSTQVN